MHSKKTLFPLQNVWQLQKKQKLSKERKEKENKIIERKKNFSIHM